jgi:2-dehydro-3-deoxyphosphogluconate aldolase / (4S)-4-hydroxy-2-oxoglutarate aldolase
VIAGLARSYERRRAFLGRNPLAGKQGILRRLRDHAVVAVIRCDSAEVLPSLAECLRLGGMRTLEITMTTPSAPEIIRRLIADPQNEKSLIGAGTVLNVEQAQAVIEAGAHFIVSPTVEPEVIRYCNAQDVLVIPGAMTPTEILTAWRLGADIVKVFPAGALGANYLADVAGPLPQIPLLATGGIGSDNAVSFLKAGAVAVGIGSAVLDKNLIATARFDELRLRIADLMDRVSKRSLPQF